MGKKKAIPKKVAGFKVPKALRKSRLLRQLLRSPVGRGILAKALTAGAGAAAAALVEHRDEVGKAAAGGARKGSRTVARLTSAVHDGADAILGVLGEAAQSIADPDGDEKREARH